jgi:excisionase family DNA binding protein
LNRNGKFKHRSVPAGQNEVHQRGRSSSAAWPGPDRRKPKTVADQIASYRGALTARELSSLLSISVVTIFKMAASGRLPSFRVGSCVRFCPVTIARWLRERGG